jgi:putative tryptophan/tyrosine transport system substrate-binding protein
MMRIAMIAFMVIALLAAPLAAGAQQAGKPARIGFLGLAPTPTPHKPYPAFLNPFFEGLRERGWVEGQNVTFEFREGPDLQGNATELVGLKVDVIVALSTLPTFAAKVATRTIPIVFAASDVVEQGLVASHARPGGNLTGLDWEVMELAGKRVQLLKEALPRIRRLAILVDPDHQLTRRWVAESQRGAQAVGVELQAVEARVNQLSDAFATMTASRAEAVIVTGSARYWAERKRIVELAARHRLPSMFDTREFVEDGGLMCYEGATIAEAYRLITKHVDRILRGANPADLPVEQPTTFALRINLKTAKALGLTIPPSVLARADEVIQ